MINHVEKPLSSRPIIQKYKDAWDAIFGKKPKPKKKTSKIAKDAASRVLRNPNNSKKAKVARGEALTQKSKPKWGDPTINME